MHGLAVVGAQVEQAHFAAPTASAAARSRRHAKSLVVNIAESTGVNNVRGCGKSLALRPHSSDNAILLRQLRYNGVMRHCLIAAAAGAGIVAMAGIQIVIQPTPWYSAQTVVPVCGMVLGNALNTIGLGLRTFLAGVADSPAPIRLAIGLG